MFQKVLAVNHVELAILKSNPPQLAITAIGIVPTTGWKNGELVPYVYIQPPPDGIYDFDFVAEPPDGPAGQALQPITASLVCTSTDGMKGVRIHASSNKIEKRLGDARQLQLQQL